MTKVGSWPEMLAGASVITGKKNVKTSSRVNLARNATSVQETTSTPCGHNRKEQESLNQFLQRYRNSFFVNKKV